jgi:hypothetical protein
MRLVDAKPLWFETERVAVKVSALGLTVGRALETLDEAIEERYYAPSLVLAVVLVLFIFLS